MKQKKRKKQQETPTKPLSVIIDIDYEQLIRSAFEKVTFEKSHKRGKGVINAGIWKMS